MTRIFNEIKSHETNFRECSACFHQKKSPVRFAFVGDSRTRSLVDFFEAFFNQSWLWEEIKPHHDFNATFQDMNAQLDFIWAPQTELGNQ